MNKLNKTILFENEYCIVFQVVDNGNKIWYRKDKILNTKTIIDRYFDYNENLQINKIIKIKNLKL